MQGVFVGFATIGLLIGLGILLAHLGIIDEAGQRTLSTLAFFVASPALLLTVLESSDLRAVFSGNVVALAGAVVVSVAVIVAVSVIRGEDLATTTIAAQCSAYANAGNLGLPIAAYVLGDAALVAPLLLLQLLVLQPLVLTLLDAAVSPTRLSVGAVLARPFKNPITVGSALGLALAISGVRLPQVLNDPLELVAGMAVPSMLLAYGVSLRLGPLPGRGVSAGQLGLVVGLKMLVQPLSAYLIGRFLIGLDTEALLAVTVLSSLPTAQNVFVIASRYNRGALLARDAIFVSTIASVPVVLIVTALIA
ncbi:AEC family transporter [Kribbella sp. NPDC006257]|uniref:AEC family transporter n=1 Tax=Kribbella sp. NPDC006257 TaxID=3156738 RepID=UPI0033BCE782